MKLKKKNGNKSTKRITLEMFCYFFCCFCFFCLFFYQQISTFKWSIFLTKKEKKSKNHNSNKQTNNVRRVLKKKKITEKTAKVTKSAKRIIKYLNIFVQK